MPVPHHYGQVLSLGIQLGHMGLWGQGQEGLMPVGQQSRKQVEISGKNPKCKA